MLVKVNKPIEIMGRLGVVKRGKVQRFVDLTVAKGMDKYVPFKTGTLKNSVLSSAFGSGLLVYNTPYAKRQYETNRGEGTRGKEWAERYLKENRERLVREVQSYADRY